MKPISLVLIMSLLLLIFPYSKKSYGMSDSMKKQKFFIVDSHNDTMMKIVDEETWLPIIDIRENTSLQVDIPKMKKGNFDVAYFAAYSSAFYGNPNRSVSRTLALINGLYYTQKRNQDQFSISPSVEKIKYTLDNKKIAGVPAIEGAYFITSENGEEILNQYYDLGVRSIGFTWNYSNALGEGLHKAFGDKNGTRSPVGLTPLGIKTIERMNNLGIIVDVSHLSPASFWDVIKNSKTPIIASHSGAYSVNPHVRNLYDDQIKAVGENGGVIGVVYHDEFVKTIETASVAYIVDHIDYIVNLIGIDHVGLGSDFDGANLPKDLPDASKLGLIVDELVLRGYSDEDIEKICSKNHLRVLQEVEALSEKKISIDNHNIYPYFIMGEKFDTKTPLFRARITGDKKDIQYKFIINGIAYNIEPNGEMLEFQINEPLKEKFYVVSFEGKAEDGEVTRTTKIVYIK
ncbi:MAG: dipeptidase [Gudongella sp.]|nr:dipeptidase [Gudongella sp.]